MCNDLDDDCDGQVDEGLPTQTIYKDNDGDGWAALNAASQDKCDVPVGWTRKNNPPDCDDTDVTAFPGATETCDGKGNDCNGRADQHCAEPCGPNFPVTLVGAVNGWSAIVFDDVNKDGVLEVLARSSSPEKPGIARVGAGNVELSAAKCSHVTCRKKDLTSRFDCL